MAPIALFVYNRPDHTKETINALLQNKEASDSDLYIFADAARDNSAQVQVDDVREFIHSVNGFKSITIVEQTLNLGLANSIIQGVTRLCSQFDSVIVLEDDLVVSPFFLKYMNDALVVYCDDEDVANICGYMYPIKHTHESDCLLVRFAMSWGWATWSKSWELFNPNGQALLDEIYSTGQAKNFNRLGPPTLLSMLKGQIAGENNSWYIRWCASLFLNNKLSLAPKVSLVNNIGIDGSGLHCSEWEINPYSVPELSHMIKVEKLDADQALNGKVFSGYFLKVGFLRYFNAIYRLLSIKKYLKK